MTTTDTIDLAGLDGAPVSLAATKLEDLDSRVQGRLLVAGDQGWNDAVAIWNGMAARLPALVLQPASAHEVAAAVGFARDHGLLLSVKGGGHNIAGTSIAEDGLVLEMSGMRAVTVDPEARLAQVGPGCLLGEVDQATPPRPTSRRPPMPSWPSSPCTPGPPMSWPASGSATSAMSGPGPRARSTARSSGWPPWGWS